MLWELCIEICIINLNDLIYMNINLIKQICFGHHLQYFRRTVQKQYKMTFMYARRTFRLEHIQYWLQIFLFKVGDLSNHYQSHPIGFVPNIDIVVKINWCFEGYFCNGFKSTLLKLAALLASGHIQYCKSCREISLEDFFLKFVYNTYYFKWLWYTHFVKLFWLTTNYLGLDFDS